MRPFVALYDIQYQTKDYDAEAATALAFLGLRSGAKILEIGAGTGGHSAALARRGITVTAVEIDADMAELGQAKTADMPMVRWYVGSIENAPHIVTDGACALFYVVNYVLTRPALMSLLTALRMRLADRARFTFDCWNGLEAMRATMPPLRRSFDAPGGGAVVQVVETKVDVARQEAILHYSLETPQQDGTTARESEEFPVRLWTRRELEEALEEAGFQVLEVRDGRAPDKPAEADSARLWFTAAAI